MKKIKVVLIAAAILFGTQVSAQSPLTFGVRGGVNLSNIIGDETDDFNPLVGFNAGVTMDFQFAPSMSLMTGLNFTTKGFRTSESGSEDGYSWSETSTFRPMYLQLPVHFGYKFVVAPGTRLVLHAGPYIAYGIGGRSSWEWSETFDGDTETESGSSNIWGEKGEDGEREDVINRFDFGVGIGVGLQLPNRMTVGLGFDLGLANLVDNSDVPSQYHSTLRNMNAHLTVGFRF